MKTDTKPVGVPVQFVRRDIAEIAVGACVMAFPAATAQEIWDLGAELTVLRVLLFGLASLFFLAVLVFLLHHGPEVPGDRGVFLQRVFSTYGLTLVIAALLLFGIDRLDLFAHPLVAIKRTVLVAFPACFAATVVDNLGG
jgi:uncharacterized membrane protein